jgi:1,4-dihydroxy-2-naphthoate octaprenyltransferase
MLLAAYLNEYFGAANQQFYAGSSQGAYHAGVLGEAGLSRQVALFAAWFCTALAAAAVYTMNAIVPVPITAWLLLLVLAFIAVFHSLPPIELGTSGYGELAFSVGMGLLIPAFSYTLQAQGIHRLILMSGIPLVAVHFAMLLALQLRSYARYVKHEHKTLMVRLGWAAGMRLHDLALLFAAGSLIVAYLLGLPSRPALGSLIAVPLGLAQVWLMSRIRQGEPPRWRPLTANAVALLALTAYLQLAGYLEI